jgi:lactate dehydrogenase-like 2-hydroxyacid dehydrogenase
LSIKEKILCLFHVSEKDFKKINDEWIDFSDVELQILSLDTPEDSICAAASDSTIIFAGIGRPAITRKIIEASSNLKLIQMPGAGYDEVDISAANEMRVPVATTKAANAKAVAEHVIMFILTLLNRGIYAHETTSSGDWPQMELLVENRTLELGGKTLGILGLGAVGKDVARIVRGFGTQVIYHNRNRLILDDEDNFGVEYVGFHELFSRSDILSIHVPLTPDTVGMIGRNEIDLMKDGAILINTARGAVVEEQALVDALKEGKLFGAGLDVFDFEPLGPGNVFSRLENVILSPHIAGGTVESIVRMIESAGKNMALVIEGKRPLNIVNDV